MKIRWTLILSALFLGTTLSIAQAGGKASPLAPSTLSDGINLRASGGATATSIINLTVQ